MDLSNDFQELGELVDFEAEEDGAVSLAMHERVYNHRGVHEHVQRFRELISLEQCYVSPSSSMDESGAAENEDGNAASETLDASGANAASAEESREGVEATAAAAAAEAASATGNGGGPPSTPERKKKKKKGKGKHGGGGGGGGRAKANDDVAPMDETSKEDEKQVVPDYDEAFLNAGISPDYPPMVELAPRAAPKTPATLKELHLSAWDPVPEHRWLVGDLVYLDLTTLEGRTYCVTAHCRGFFINKSSPGVFDPRPANPKLKPYQTLVALMQSLSPQFNAGFLELQQILISMHPLEAQPTPPPPGINTFFVPVDEDMVPAVRPAPSFGRAETALHNWTGGWDSVLEGRDWNEEYQSCRELPSSTLQERLLRDRTLYRINTDFVAAATQGAKLVVEGNVTALNPADAVPYQMFVHNNIFYSYAHDLDADEEKAERENLEKERAAQKEEGEESQTQSSDADVIIENGNGESAEKTSSADVDTTQDSEADMDAEYLDGEQATFISANNDMRGTRAFADADVEGLHTLTMAIVDYCGSRVIAQSIIPGILHGDRTESLKYGSVDGGKKIAWEEAYHERVTRAAKICQLQEHSIQDASGNEYKFSAPSECKGIEGSDGRFYLLDLVRVTPRDVLWTGRSSSCALLRPELIRSLCTEDTENEGDDAEDGSEDAAVTTDVVDTAADSSAPSESHAKDENGGNDADVSNGSAGNGGDGDTPPTDATAADAKNAAEDFAPAPAEWQKSLPPLNPNASTEAKLGGPDEIIALHEDQVRRASEALRTHVIPRFVSECKSLEPLPLDGLTLTEAMHSSGINMRYLGMIAEQTKSLPHIQQLCICEMVARCAKHELRSLLRSTLPHGRADVISRFLSALVGQWPSQRRGSGSSNESGGDGRTRSSFDDGENGDIDGIAENSKPQTAASKKRSRLKRRAAANAMSLMTADPPSDLPLELTHEGVFGALRTGADARYQYDLDRMEYNDISKLALLRSVCLKVGISLMPREYDFTSSWPVHIDDVRRLEALAKSMMDAPASASGTAPGGGVAAPAGPDGFRGVRGCCRDGRSFLEAGKAAMLAGNLTEAIEMLNEASAILSHVYGPLHRYVGAAAKLLAMCAYHSGEQRRAVEEQRRELLINERVLGPEHPLTIHSYASLALFHHGLGQSDAALRHMHRVLQLLDLVCGRSHPECTTTFINVAMMYQDIGKVDVALRYLQEALTRTERVLGSFHTQAAVCYHALAIVFNCAGNFKLAIAHERKTYEIFKHNLGEEDRRTKHAAYWMRQFTIKELQQKEMKKRQLVMQQLEKDQDGANGKVAGNGNSAQYPSSMSAGTGLNYANMFNRRKHIPRGARAKVSGPGVGANGTIKANALNTMSVDDVLRFIET